ncbi:PREDICTED: uncharacterized protein LOC109147396 [Ipomoea nil]|uniref:uncharacterized protein LOC109147396 n=1 Tax=Ipomoea nil TaxID=35883 RepID=UPI0009018CB1|nr:PREDICTED: uncharacterized protein LOC109147396 [Ipomoea nil]
MAKMITHRMKPLMQGIISDSQSAFIPDRLITDNILIVAEVGHYLNRKQCGVVGWGALKLDMAKAYDCKEWSFLHGMLLALGSRSDPITPTRGLRQGDPLSPYLFIICMEGLSLLLQQAQSKGLIHGCRVARGTPLISHLFFADDSLLFFKANVHEATEIKNCLSLYENWSGQQVNYHKPSICYSKNTCHDDKNMVAHILGVTHAPNFGKYLGLPSFVGRNKKAAFAYIEDKIRQRIGSWNKKLLSQGKEILLKSVAHAIPTFSMGVFQLPISVCIANERVINRYWWGSGNDQGIHWKTRDRLCIPKKYGGLGFKDLRAFNLAMLGKQAWRLLTNTDSLVSRVYKARYYPKDSFTEACLGNNPSFCWRSIMEAKGLICNGVRRRNGNGKSTLIWDHPWLQNDQYPMIHTEMPPSLLELKLWYGDPNGCYSVKSCYRRIIEDYGNNNGAFDKWLTLWKIKAPPKWKTFLWRAISDILPTTNNLLIKRVEVNPTCAMCGIMNEDTMHSLVLCDYAKSIWTQSNLPLPIIITNIFHEWFSAILNVLDSNGIIYATAILYHIWKTRNGAVWDACLPMPKKVIAIVAATMHAWKKVHHRVHEVADHAARATIATAEHTSPVVRTGHIATDHSAEQAAPPPSQPAYHDAAISTRKCYVDAGYHHGRKSATIGAVLLDSDGHFILAFSAPLVSCFSPLMAEAFACKEALSWLRERGEQSIQIYTDCQTLQCYLSAPDIQSRSYIGYGIDSCRMNMSAFAS